MVDWVEKYRPSAPSEVRSNNRAHDALAEWTKMWDDHREAVAVHGNPGIGKTSVAHAFAIDMGWETVGLNTSDQRANDIIERLADRAAKNATFVGSPISTPTRQLIILDEVNDIHGNYGRGGASAVTRLVKSSNQPVVLTANELYDTSRRLRNAHQEIEFRDVSARSIVSVLRDVCRGEGLKFESGALDRITEMNSGDLQSAVNDLQAITEGHGKVTREDVVMGDRDRSVGLFEFLDAVPKEGPVQGVLYTIYSVDETPDDLARWVEDKMSLVYEPDEFTRAYNLLVNADRQLSYVRATQDHSYQRYTTNNLAAGIAASRGRTRGRWTRYDGTSYRLTRNKTRDTVVRRIAQNDDFSMTTARRETPPYLSTITHRCRPHELAVAMTAHYKSDELHVSLVTRNGRTTNKVRLIIGDAGGFRKELVEEHTAGMFTGTEGASIGDDAAADGSGDEADNVLDRDAGANADELAENDDFGAAINDG